MNHSKVYQQIITASKKEHRATDSSTYESHHIKPKTLGGGNEKDNIVLLTFREHYLCHYLLTKIYPNNNNLHFAFWGMNNQQSGNSKRNYINSRLYEVAKCNVAQMMLGNTFQKSSHSDETKKLMSKQATGEHHHTFKGYFITPWGKFASQRAAVKGYNLSTKGINMYCKDPLKTLTAYTVAKSHAFTIDDIGKTFSELGFSFEPAERIAPKPVVKPYDPTNHSQFKGYYITPWKKYVSNYECERDMGMDISLWCTKPYRKLRRQTVNKFPKYFNACDIGKTALELGFGFEPVDRKQ